MNPATDRRWPGRLPAAGRCLWCGGVLRSQVERAARQCWICAFFARRWGVSRAN
jgi:hypothetical protein